ncbi:MAG: UvrD-helicase domain-containing protein, partial [Firmicutes bacterium]|nr:UvrD-helicase domain-containing protein [Bacillota bacterium]
MKWTPEQARAIELRDKNILVAAAAGSGKTAVLVERIKRLILEDKCPIDRMLIVTFTNAAASEMKEKIRRAIGQTVDELAEKAEAGDEQAAEDLTFLKEQLNLLPQAQISTFHAFALEIIRKYFYVIDVEPNFKICDDAQQVILRAEAMDALLEEQFEEGGEEFLRFLDCYSGDRNENRFREMIDHAYDTIQALPEPAQWLHEKVGMLAGNEDEENTALKQVMEVLWGMAEQNLKDAEAAINTNLRRAREAELPDAAALAEDDLIQIAKIREAFGDYDVLRDALGAFKLGTLRKTLYNPPEDSSLTSEEAEAMKNAASAGRDLAKKKVKALREEYFAQSAYAMADEMAQTYADAALIEKLLTRYSQLYREEKQHRGLVDFSDIEHYAWEILKDEEVSRYYREKYLHIFVDEYQDSNVMQEAFLQRICRENNLFLVGDVKQSIYKFRLAEPEIFQKRYQSYSQEENLLSEKIDLNRNFRSKRPVIDFVNEVFDFVMDGYDDAAALHMGDPFGDHYYDEP